MPVQEYWVTLQQDPTQQQLQLLRAGTVIEGVHVVPKVVRIRQSASPEVGKEEGHTDMQQRGKGSRSRHQCNSSSSSRQRGRCVVQLDVSEGKKHEV